MIVPPRGSAANSLTAPAIKDLINGIRAASRNKDHVKASEYTTEALGKLANYLTTAAPVLQSASTPPSVASLYFNAGSGTTLSPNIANGTTQEFTLTGDATINALTGGAPGDEIVLVLVQDATGGRQVASWDASYHFPGTFGLDPTPATATVFTFRVNAAGNLFLTCAPITALPWP
jgi:hypothetical protein